jgi:hypothetical protein
MAPFYAVLEVICVFFVVVYGRIWRTATPETMDPKKIARYRWSTLTGAGFAVIIAVRLPTHTYG